MTHLWRTCQESPENLSRIARELVKNRPIISQDFMCSKCSKNVLHLLPSKGLVIRALFMNSLWNSPKCARKVLKMLLKSSQNILNEFLKCTPFVTLQC
jgi:hypothetical protein